MPKKPAPSKLARYALAWATLTLLAGLVSGVAWLLLGQKTLAEFATILMWFGIAVTSFGAMRVVGAFSAREEDTSAFSFTRHTEASNHLRRFSQDMAGRLGCLALVLVEGVLLLVTGTLLGGDPFPSGY